MGLDPRDKEIKININDKTNLVIIMRYFGSKATVVPELYRILSGKISEGSFCDPFGGIGTIGSFFKSKNYQVTSGDILTFAHYFQLAKISQNNLPHFEKLFHYTELTSCQDIIDYLNNIKPRRGWFFKNYADERHFFTPQNGAKIDACWTQIRFWENQGLLTYSEKAVLLASLINSMDKYANCAGTYYAFLKKWYQESLQPFRFEFLKFISGNLNCKCFHCDAIKVTEKQKFDILYLDPPYNSRPYAFYYHLPETIALCRTPKIHGKSGMPLSERPKSAFNYKGSAKKELQSLLENSRFHFLAFHYADNGIISQNELRTIFMAHGDVEEFKLIAKGYTNKSQCRDVIHQLYVVET